MSVSPTLLFAGVNKCLETTWPSWECLCTPNPLQTCSIDTKDAYKPFADVVLVVLHSSSPIHQLPATLGLALCVSWQDQTAQSCCWPLPLTHMICVTPSRQVA